MFSSKTCRSSRFFFGLPYFLSVLPSPVNRLPGRLFSDEMIQQLTNISGIEEGDKEQLLDFVERTGSAGARGEGGKCSRSKWVWVFLCLCVCVFFGLFDF